MGTEKTRIGIIGAGAIGGVVGGLLAKAGHDVTLVDPWPEHVEQMKHGGLRLSGSCARRRAPCYGVSLEADGFGERRAARWPGLGAHGRRRSKRRTRNIFPPGTRIRFSRSTCLGKRWRDFCCARQGSPAQDAGACRRYRA